MVMRWFRRNQKLLLALLVGFLMVTWGMLPALRHFASEATVNYGDMFGKSVTPHMMERAGRELDIISMAGFMDRQPVIKYFILDSGPEEDPHPGRITTESIWRYLLLTHMAEKSGIEVFDHRVAEVLRQFPPHLQERTTYNAIKNWMGITMLIDRYQQSYGPWPTELWMEYSYSNREVRMRHVKLDPGLFAPLVEISEEDIQSFYEEHKDRRPEPRAGVFGYLAPMRVKLEYAYPAPEDIRTEIEITEADIRDYYEQNRERYRVDENEDGEIDGDERSETGSGTEEPAPEEKENDAGREEDRYTPLSEVRDEIKETLVSKKAREEARRLADAVIRDLDRLPPTRAGLPMNLQQIALRHGLHYSQAVTEDGDEYLSRSDVERHVEAGARAARLIFDEELDIGFPEIVHGRDAPVIIQLLDRREPEPEPLEDVRDRVEKDLKSHRSLAMAYEFAEELKSLAEEKDLYTAVRKSDRRLAGLLDGIETQEDENDGAAEDGEEELQYLSIGTSDRVSLEYPLVGGALREELVREVLKAAVGELVVKKEGGRRPAAFVVEKAEEKPAGPDGFEAWLRRRQQQEFQKQFQLMIAAMQGRPLDFKQMNTSQRMLWQRLQGLNDKYPSP